ncbi:hypothetical protein HPB48_016921 [Haemaphysalis longicornis]|uniref:Uncharacterized protein n=1 Tax=Haemaphysalis longicornis TaxID=44386 RepID=A0A9J6FSN9_HAELO|nr:hypothetical protein HPB48_016921 [Haemaphysalis longicornis]
MLSSSKSTASGDDNVKRTALFYVGVLSASVTVVGTCLILALEHYRFNYGKGPDSATGGRRASATTTAAAEVCARGSPCDDLSRTIKVFMNASADPCADFYDFACGRYHHPSKQTIVQMQDQMYTELPRIILSSKYPKRNQSAAQKAAALYNTCLMVYRGRVDDSEALRRFVDAVGLSAGRYAQVEALDKILLLFFKYGLLTLLGLSLEDTQLYKHVREIKVTLNSHQLRWFRQRRSNVLTSFYPPHMDALGLREGSAEATSTAMKIIEAENTAAGLLTEKTLRNYNRLVFSYVGGLNAYTPSLRPGRWKTLISAHSDNIYKADHKVQASASALAYFDSVYSNLGEKGTSLLTAWELVRTLVPLSVSRVAKRLKNYHLNCLMFAMRAMEVPLVSLYLFRVVSGSTIVHAKDMVEHIRESVMEEIRYADWLDEATRLTAYKKVQNLQAYVGYPRFYSNPKELDELYAPCPDVSGNEFLVPWLCAMKLNIDWRIRNRSDSFKFSLRTTNAAYHPMRNTLVLPATILRPPVFFLGAPMAYNYGGLGTIIGHEITHAFDLQGSMWDGRGLRRDWWSNESRLRYDDRLLCIRPLPRHRPRECGL